VSFQATQSHSAAAVAAARRSMLVGSRLVSIPPCLCPIEEEDTTDCNSTQASCSTSSSCDEIEMSFTDDDDDDDDDDESSALSDDNHTPASAAANHTQPFDRVYSADVSSHHSK